MHELEEVLRIITYEHSDFLDMRGDLANDAANRFWHHVAGTLLVEYKPESVSAGFDCGLRVLEICDSTNFYPGHQTPFQLATYFLTTSLDSRFASASRLFRAPPGDFAFINDSPIRNARYPAACRAAISAPL